MLNTDRFAKVLALAGSNMDGEALSALRKVRSMLAGAGLSFTDVAQSIGKTGGHSGHSAEIDSLRRRLRGAETDLSMSRHEIKAYKEKLEQLQRQVAAVRSQRRGTNLKRSLAQIEARMRSVLGDPRLSCLSDRELARRTGISPQAVGNWRRRLEGEREPARGHVHSGQRSRAGLRGRS
jgi:hypothetical protein